MSIASTTRFTGGSGSPDETGGSQRGEIGIGDREFAELRIQGDGFFDQAMGTLQIAPLAPVATEIESDGRILGVQDFRFGENFFGGLQGIGSPRGVGPDDPGSGILRTLPGEFGRGDLELGPLIPFLVERNAKRENLDLRVLTLGQSVQLGRRFRDHAQFEITASVRKMPARFHAPTMSEPEVTSIPSAILRVCVRPPSRSRRRLLQSQRADGWPKWAACVA